MSGSGMYKTKLCIMYQKSGNCSRTNCGFAHGHADLRRPGESSFNGRRHNLDNDLRDRLGRQFSPERRPSIDRSGRQFSPERRPSLDRSCRQFSPERRPSLDRSCRQFSPERRPSLDRSGRRVPRFYGHENTRPFENRRDRDYRENNRFDERSDYTGGLKVGNRIEDRAEAGRKKFPGYNNVLDEQLKDVDLDVKMLNDDKLRLEASIERKVHEADILTSRIDELQAQLDREKEESRRIISSSKKFVKEYNRYMRAQDDLKRSQARLEKLGTQLSAYVAGNEGPDRDAENDILSDEENNSRSLRTASDPQNELLKTSQLPRKRHYVDHYRTKEPVEDGKLISLIVRGEDAKGEKVEKAKNIPSRCNMVPSKSYSEDESGEWNDEGTINNSSPKEGNWKRRRFSLGTSSTEKVMSSTSMAARPVDEAAEFDEKSPEAADASPLISLPPPPPIRDHHFQGDEEDGNGNVDVTEQRKANDDDSL